MSSTYWCERAWLGGGEPEREVLLEVHEGVCSSVLACGPAPPADAVRLSGLTVPGFANAHSHAFQRALRGRTHGAEGTFWTWREHMYELADSVDLERFETLTREAFAEMALAGITVVGEFHYVHDGANAFGEAVARAAADVGLRLTLIDACYLHGGLPRFEDSDVEAWCARMDAYSLAGRARLAAAIHSVRAVTPAQAAAVARYARDAALPLHAHVSEQPRENEECLTEHGMTPTRLLEQAGALSRDFTAVHFTHVKDDDLARLAAAGGRVCLCPTTERDLADGVGPARRLRRAGVPLSLGSDSNAIIEPLEEARAVELDERLVSGVRGGYPAAELLWAATRGGYESLGWPDGGRLRAGAPADLVTLDTNSVRLAGVPDEHLIDALVFAGAAADVTDVMVGGEFIVREGRLTR